MAGRLLRICGIISNSAKNFNVQNNRISISPVNLLETKVPVVEHTRCSTTFFTRRPATQLWKSVTSVSNAGKRRGRGKGAPKMKDLNKGQRIGIGKVGMVFPGLNAPIYQGKELVEQRRLPDNPDREKELIQLRSQFQTSRRPKISALERGWSGGIMGGRKLGPPDPVDGVAFDNFESWVVHYVHSTTMTSVFGRVKRYSAYVVTGNGNGLAGFGTSVAGESRACLKSARNKAGQRLMYFERYDNHTVLHDFFTQFGRTKIFVKQMPKGYGLKCHRVIRACCEAIGIKDIYAKVEGSHNVPNVIKAFLIGLLRQKTYQQMANEKKLHVVEFKKEHDYFPTVVASPETVRKPQQILKNEIIDFKQYLMDGKIVLDKKKVPPFYTKLPSYAIYLRKQERKRDQDLVRIRLRTEYGDLCSFLTEKYPEARASKWSKHGAKKEEATAAED